MFFGIESHRHGAPWQGHGATPGRLKGIERHRHGHLWDGLKGAFSLLPCRMAQAQRVKAG